MNYLLPSNREILSALFSFPYDLLQQLFSLIHCELGQISHVHNNFCLCNHKPQPFHKVSPFPNFPFENHRQGYKSEITSSKFLYPFEVTNFELILTN